MLIGRILLEVTHVYSACVSSPLIQIDIQYQQFETYSAELHFVSVKSVIGI